MALFTINPTSNQTPDPGQGGLAVTGNVNTGHASSTAAKVGVGAPQDKTCIWTAFPAVAGQLLSVSLKFDWTQDGTIVAGGGNLFQVQYSLNNGSSWTTVFAHSSVTSPTSSNTTLSITPSDLTQVRIRDLLRGIGGGAGDSGSVTASISNIRLDVTTVEASIVGMM